MLSSNQAYKNFLKEVRVGDLVSVQLNESKVTVTGRVLDYNFACLYLSLSPSLPKPIPKGYFINFPHDPSEYDHTKIHWREVKSLEVIEKYKP